MSCIAIQVSGYLEKLATRIIVLFLRVQDRFCLIEIIGSLQQNIYKIKNPSILCRDLIPRLPAYKITALITIH